MPEVLNAAVVGTKDAPDRVYVGRPSMWGNPFHISRHGTREQVIEKYRAWLMHSHLVDRVNLLSGKDLVCWCAPEPCHADILLEMANRRLNDISSGSDS